MLHSTEICTDIIHGCLFTAYLFFVSFLEIRCICPGHTRGDRCNIVSRSFNGNSWAWMEPLPACLPVTVSLKVITNYPDGIIFYSGPLAPDSQKLNDEQYVQRTRTAAFQSTKSNTRTKRRIAANSKFDSRATQYLFAVQIRQGKLELVTGGRDQVYKRFILNSSSNINDSKWHSIEISLKTEVRLYL